MSTALLSSLFASDSPLNNLVEPLKAFLNMQKLVPTVRSFLR